MVFRIGSQFAFQAEQPRARSSSAPPAIFRTTSCGVTKLPVRKSNNPTILQYRVTADYQKKCIQRIENIVNAQDKLAKALRQLAGAEAIDQASVYDLTMPLIDENSTAIKEMDVPAPAIVTEDMKALGQYCIEMSSDAHLETIDAWCGFDDERDSQQLRAYCFEVARFVENKRTQLLGVRDEIVSMQRVDSAVQTEPDVVPETAEIGINATPQMKTKETATVRIKSKDKQDQTTPTESEKKVGSIAETQTPVTWAEPTDQTKNKSHHENVNDQNASHLMNAGDKAVTKFPGASQKSLVHAVATYVSKKARAVYSWLAKSWLLRFVLWYAYRFKMLKSILPENSGQLDGSMQHEKTKDKKVQTKQLSIASENRIAHVAETQAPKKIHHKYVDDLYASQLMKACDSAATALAEVSQGFPVRTAAAVAVDAIERARAMHGLLAESWLHSLDQLDAYRSKMWIGMFPVMHGEIHELTKVRLLELERFRFENIQLAGKSYTTQGDAELDNHPAVKRIRTIAEEALPQIELAPTDEVKEKMMRTLASFSEKIHSYLSGEDRVLGFDGKALKESDIEHLLFNDFFPLVAQVNLRARDLVMIDAFDELDFHNQFLFKTEEMVPDQSVVDPSRKISILGSPTKRKQCDALEAVCKTVTTLSIFEELKTKRNWNLSDIKTMAHCIVRMGFELENGHERWDKKERREAVYVFEGLKKTFEQLNIRVKDDFKIKLNEIQGQGRGQKIILNDHTELLRQIKIKIENFDELLPKLKVAVQ